MPSCGTVQGHVSQRTLQGTRGLELKHRPLIGGPQQRLSRDTPYTIRLQHSQTEERKETSWPSPCVAAPVILQFSHSLFAGTDIRGDNECVEPRLFATNATLPWG